MLGHGVGIAFGNGDGDRDIAAFGDWEGAKFEEGVSLRGADGLGLGTGFEDHVGTMLELETGKSNGRTLFTSNLILSTTKPCDLPVGPSLDSEVGAMEPPTTWNGPCPRTLGQHGQHRQPSGEAESGKLPNLHFYTYFSDSCGVSSPV